MDGILNLSPNRVPKAEAVLAIVAIVVSIVSLVLSYRTSQEQNRQQAALLRLESGRERDRVTAKNRANISARLYHTGHSARLVIQNAGPAPARITGIAVDGKSVVEHQLIRANQPVKSLAPDAAVELLMVTYDGMPDLFQVDITWDDDSGIPGTWSSQLSLTR